MSPIVVRPLGPADSMAELTALLHRAYAELGAMGLRFAAVDQSENITRERIASGRCFVATLDGVVVGTILYHPPRADAHVEYYRQPGVAVLGQFGVDPIQQRNGIGLAMFAHVESIARSEQIKELALDTSENATHLVELYKTHGFRIVGFHQWSMTNYRSVIMSKTL